MYMRPPPVAPNAAAPLVVAVTKLLCVCCCVCVSRENQVNQNERIIRAAQKKNYTTASATYQRERRVCVCDSVCGVARNGTKRDETKRALLALQ